MHSSLPALVALLGPGTPVRSNARSRDQLRVGLVVTMVATTAWAMLP
jgi:hypothetical protein